MKTGNYLSPQAKKFFKKKMESKLYVGIEFIPSDVWWTDNVKRLTVSKANRKKIFNLTSNN